MRATLGIAFILFLIGITANVASSDDPGVAREFSIPEDAGAGHPVGVVAREADANEPASVTTWSIAHDGQAIPFVIDGRTGALTHADQPLDHERQSRHEFSVRARRPRTLDSARRAYLADLLESGVDPETIDDLLFEVTEQRIAVNIIDVPEPPVLTVSTLSLVLDDAGRAATPPLSARDPDGQDALSFELIAGDAERFEIDPQSGAVQWREGASAESGTFPLTVRVTDRTGLSDAATFTVEVIAPAMAAPVIVADIVPPEADPVAPAAEAVAAVRPQAEAEEEVVPPDVDRSPIAVTSEPVETGVEPSTAAAPIAASSQPVKIAPDTRVSVPVAVADPSEEQAALAPVSVEQSVAASAGFDFTGWLPLVVSLLAGLVVGAWLRRRRLRIEAAVQSQPFRVVREAPASSEAYAALDLPAAMAGEALPADGLAALEAAHAEKAAVHELIASAFQQATGQSLAIAPPAPVTAEMPPSEAVAEELPFAVAGDPLMELRAIADEFETPEAVGESLESEAPMIAPVGLEHVDPMERLEPAFPASHDLAGALNESVDDEDGYGTEPYTSPHAVEEEHAPESYVQELAESVAPDLPADLGSSIPTMYGYGVEDDELVGGYQGLRLSQASEPAPVDEHVSYGDIPADTTDEYRAQPAMGAADEEEDQKLKDLRRQLSDLFGVPADRPRPAAVMDTVDEPEVETIAASVVDEPAPTIELQPGMLEVRGVPEPPLARLSPPPASSPIPTAAAAPAAPASDPVHSWLEYLKQRALEKPGTPSSPASTTASSYAMPATAPAPAPAKPAPAPVAAFVAAARQVPPPVRVNKSAVREEISMLRDLANQHSRNVLARRALNQRARITWLLWGAAMVVLCFSGVWSVRHDAGGMRLLGWGLLAGAGVALGCCVYGFHRLNQRSTSRAAEEEADELATVEDLEATTAPELMTPEMEQRLREVLEEARNVPAAAEAQS